MPLVLYADLSQLTSAPPLRQTWYATTKDGSIIMCQIIHSSVGYATVFFFGTFQSAVTDLWASNRRFCSLLWPNIQVRQSLSARYHRVRD